MKRAACMVFLFCQMAFAGGPLNVAGVSGFQSGLAGTPITWENGQVDYYTDQGDLSPLLPNATADQFVADAFARWTSINTAAVRAVRAGSLAEDVNGTNVTLMDGTLSLPDDLKPESSKPLAVVYDADGRVTDALMGSGAGAPELCSTNSIYAAPDRFNDDGHIAHALIILNGNCAKTADQLPILKYRLVRALGRVLGLDYSQLNDNVVFGFPSPGMDDYAGFPVMHPLPVLCTVGNCLPNADIPRMDDRAAISRLYPVTDTNIAGYSGKTIFKESSGRIYGSVRFPAGQGMQGVNVVARMVDTVTGRVSRSYAASSVSGFLFRGSAGNPITGYMAAAGRRLDQWGSDDPALEGFFDLAGLEIPAGYDSVVYELSVEAVNPLYADSTSVGSYHAGPVAPSGSHAAMRVTVGRGAEIEQNIDMQGGASEAADSFEPSSFLTPAAIPAGGTWVGSLSGYGDLDFFLFTARANRTFTFDVTALDAAGLPTTAKAEPVLGAWTLSDLLDAPSAWQSFFNASQTGTTRLQAEIYDDATFKLGIADYRSDGRPDYLYQARIFYADNIAPARIGVQGGTATISGLGFSNNLRVEVDGAPVNATTISPTQIAVVVPPLADQNYSITVTDLNSDASSTMDYVLRVGSVDSRLILLGGSNPQVPVGTQAPNPFRVRVIDSYTDEPVSGATVNFSAPASAAIVGCSQSPCPILTGQNGEASVYVVIKVEGPSVIEASLPTGGSTAVTINGIAATLEIVLDHPVLYLASGTSTTVPVQATVVVNGFPLPNRKVNFLLNSGTATFMPASPQTNASGVATTNVSVNNLTSDVNISACVDPDDAPCRTLVIHAVAASAMNVQVLSGNQQAIRVGENFVPMVLKVTDTNGNPVQGATVSVLVNVFRATSEPVRVVSGEVVTSTHEEPVVLSTSVLTLFADANGIVTIPISVSELQPVKVVLQVRAGQSQTTLVLSSTWDASGQPVTAPAAVQATGIAIRMSREVSESQDQTVLPGVYAIGQPSLTVIEYPVTVNSKTTNDKSKASDKECRSKKKSCRKLPEQRSNPKSE